MRDSRPYSVDNLPLGPVPAGECSPDERWKYADRNRPFGMERAADWQNAERRYDDPVFDDDTISRLFEESASRHHERIAQGYKGGVYNRSLAGSVLEAAPPGEFRTVTYGTMADIVRCLATGFRDLGIAADDRVGLYANTRMEWAQCDFAVLAAGAIVSTVYTDSSTEQVEYLLGDPGASAVICENPSLCDRVLEAVRNNDLDVEFVVVMDAFEPDRFETAPVPVYPLSSVYERGADRFDPEQYESWLAARDPGDLASLVYTSGTTGRPKGVRLTHRNFRSNVAGIYRRFGPRPDKGSLPALDETTRALSFLPLAHVFERTAGHFVPFGAGATVAYAESPDTIAEDFEKVRPTTTTSVPRVYERLFDRMREQAGEGPRKRVFDWALGVAREHHRVEHPNAGLRAKRALADRLVFDTVGNALGGRIDFFISGGGSLSSDLSELFLGMGLPLLEGYGLTETAPVVTTNPIEAPASGTIGPPLSNVEVRIDPDPVADDMRTGSESEVGELLVRGPSVSSGYWERPGATEQAFTDEGWFRTGDIVARRPDGYLVYHDRLKQLLVLSTGTNVAPEPIERRFATSDRIDQCMVVGDNRKFVAALLVPNFEALDRWAEREGVDLPTGREARCRDERVRQWIGRVVERANNGLADYERIKRFELVPTEWTPENDLLTPSMKKKRRNLLARYDDRIESIYADHRSQTLPD